MEFHISRAVRDSFKVDDLLFSYTGNIVFANVTASRKLAQAMNAERSADADPATAINAGALFAMGLIDELNHALIARYRKEIDPEVLSKAVQWFASQAEPSKLDELLLTFTNQFPNVAIYRNQMTSDEWLKRSTEDLPNREAALEELLMLWLANINPAFAPFRRLFDDQGLKQQTIYQAVTESFPNYLDTRPPFSPEIGSLFEALRAPMLASPDSLTGQLDYMRELLAEHIGEDLRRVLLAIDTVREEDVAIWMRFHPPAPDKHLHGNPGWGAEGFVGDEFVGFDHEFGSEFVTGPDGVRSRRYATDYQAPLVEYEAFSVDQAWMPNVVLMAKSTYVWLEQLSKKYGRHIQRLDQIPDEELHLMATRGITGLWLIGLWERSTASRTIKRLRGNADAVASAYSLKGYDIAEDLGGSSGYEDLKRRAGMAGLRLASDMVPNHMGIDSDWVIDNPDMFLSRWESPFPSYSFDGPDLSSNSRVEIKIEDHYYEQTDAAVVFRLRHHNTGATRYMYHGNDGTTFAWNDTAQLDYAKASVREHVMQTILHVARLFPIIRFDAAMVLAKRHVQRLWFPLPGAGGSIPSRAENAMSQEEFDALMPLEFWREVVDRVAVEVPGTLLLAEAFWLLEGYFVRTLGMHRVYNSAFMNMLRDEENAKYRSYLKKTIEFDPDILKRYVNFMSNPDEKTAAEQFGTGDKYFGVCTLLATLPGLPMFAHGQIEGLGERYGMDFKQARVEEWPDENLIARHQYEIAPLLKNRRIFAESANFILYDFWNGHGTVDENVFAYSNRFGDESSIVLYNNAYQETHGTIHVSAASMDKGSGELRQRSLADGLALPGDASVIVAFRDSVRGLEYLQRASDFQSRGLTVALGGYQCIVLLGWRELRSTAEEPWDRLCDSLQGSGVSNLHQALSKMRLDPLHQALRDVVNSYTLQVIADFATSSTEHLPAEQTIAEPLEDAPAEELSRSIPAHGIAEIASAPEASEPSHNPEEALRPIIERVRTFIHRLQETLPAGGPTSNDAADAFGQSLTAKLIEKLTAAVSLPTLTPEAQSDSSEIATPLPVSPTTAFPSSTGAPVLAWIVVDTVSKLGKTGKPLSNRTAWFDGLELRSALAEAFSHCGLQGEDKWRAAVQVRLLLAYPGDPAATLQSDTFWSDPDVHWLAGIHASSGTMYCNQERFEALVAWVYLPSLLDSAADPVTRNESVEAIRSAARKAALAGYDLKAFLEPAEPAPATTEKTAETAPVLTLTRS